MILVKMANVLMIISKGQMYKKGSMLSFDIVNIFWQWGGHQGIVLRGLCPVVAVLNPLITYNVGLRLQTLSPLRMNHQLNVLMKVLMIDNTTTSSEA